MKETDSKILDILKFPLAIFVVSIHCYINIDGWDINSLSEQALSGNIAVYFMILGSKIFTEIAVPVFYVISGYLFFLHLEKWDIQIWKKKMQSRIRTLVVPYFLWNTLFILQILLFKVAAIVLKGKPISGISTWIQSNGGLLNMFWNCNQFDSPILIPMWFIRDLIVAVLLSPVFYWLLKKRNGISNAISFVSIATLCIIYIFNFRTGITGLNILTFFYFGLGAFLMLHNVSISEFFNKIKFFLLFYLVLLVIETMCYGKSVPNEGMIFRCYILSGVLAAFIFISLLYDKSKHIETIKQFLNHLGEMKQYTFFIFAFHAFILMYVKSAVGICIKYLTHNNNIYSLEFLEEHPMLTILNYLLVITITILLCILSHKIMHRFLPRFTNVLCGQKNKAR